MLENTEERKTDINFDKLWDYNNPAETEKKFRELLPELKQSQNQSEYLQLLTQIARTLGLQMKFDEAHKILDEVESLLTDELYVVKIRYLLERGRTFNSSNQKEKSKNLFLKAYEIALKNGEDSYAIDAAHMMGIIEPYEEAQKWNETAMKLAEKSSDESAKGWLGSLYNNVGWTYFDMKEYGKALGTFEKCLEWNEERNIILRVFFAKWSVSKALRLLGRVDEALSIQQALLAEMETGKAEQDGFVYEELGECYLFKGNKEDAKKYFGLAHDLLSKDIWFIEEEKERLHRLKELGDR